MIQSFTNKAVFRIICYLVFIHSYYKTWNLNSFGPAKFSAAFSPKNELSVKLRFLPKTKAKRNFRSMSSSNKQLFVPTECMHIRSVNLWFTKLNEVDFLFQSFYLIFTNFFK